jgi:hypothetical protein
MEKLDLVDAERFITLIKREPFDYTGWQETLYDGMSVEEICAAAVARRSRTEKTKAACGKRASGRRKANKSPIFA